MASTLPLAATAQTSGPAPRTAIEPADAPPEANSFADAMQAQEAPAANAETQPAANSAPETPPSRRASTAATAASEAGTDDGEVTLDASKVDTLLGLCEGAPAAVAAPTSESAAALPAGPLDAVTGAAAAACVALPVPSIEAPQPAPSAAPETSATFEPAFATLEDMRTTAAAAAASTEGALATRLEATLAEGDNSVSFRDVAAAGTSAALLDTRAATAARTPEPQASAARAPELRAPFGTPGWTDELGTRVTWMVEQGEQVASLRLSPENLGPLDVRIAVREGETTVWFGAAHPETRAALEQSLPRLREMLGASGLALANAGVFSQTPRDPQRGFTAAALARAAAEGGADMAVANVNGVTHRGLVDLYA